MRAAVRASRNPLARIRFGTETSQIRQDKAAMLVIPGLLGLGFKCGVVSGDLCSAAARTTIQSVNVRRIKRRSQSRQKEEIRNKKQERKGSSSRQWSFMQAGQSLLEMER